MANRDGKRKLMHRALVPVSDGISVPGRAWGAGLKGRKRRAARAVAVALAGILSIVPAMDALAEELAAGEDVAGEQAASSDDGKLPVYSAAADEDIISIEDADKMMASYEDEETEWEEVYIDSVEDMKAFSRNCWLDTWSVNKKVYLTSDLDLSGSDFVSIPTFGGYFNGQGHTVSGLLIRDSLSYTGLFCYTQESAVIANLKVQGNVRPSGKSMVVGGIVGDNSGIVINCAFEGNVDGNDYVGGITGFNEQSGILIDCKCSGKITGAHYTGGIAGENVGNIVGCANEADVNVSNEDKAMSLEDINLEQYAVGLLDVEDGNGKTNRASAINNTIDSGGIAGLSMGIIQFCSNSGTVGYEHVGYNTGGIVGRQSGYVYSCENTGTVYGRKDVGGIAGQTEPYIAVDLSEDIAYQLSENIDELHDLTGRMLDDAGTESDTVSARLTVIQDFVDKALDDTNFLADRTIEWTDGMIGSANDVMGRLDYIMDETAKEGGFVDQGRNAARDVRDAARELGNTVEALDIYRYMSAEERAEYDAARSGMEDASTQYAEDYADALAAYRNYYIDKVRSDPANGYTRIMGFSLYVNAGDSETGGGSSDAGGALGSAALKQDSGMGGTNGIGRINTGSAIDGSNASAGINEIHTNSDAGSTTSTTGENGTGSDTDEGSIGTGGNGTSGNGTGSSTPGNGTGSGGGDPDAADGGGGTGSGGDHAGSSTSGNGTGSGDNHAGSSSDNQNTGNEGGGSSAPGSTSGGNGTDAGSDRDNMGNAANGTGSSMNMPGTGGSAAGDTLDDSADAEDMDPEGDIRDARDSGSVTVQDLKPRLESGVAFDWDPKVHINNGFEDYIGVTGWVHYKADNGTITITDFPESDGDQGELDRKLLEDVAKEMQQNAAQIESDAADYADEQYKAAHPGSSYTQDMRDYLQIMAPIVLSAGGRMSDEARARLETSVGYVEDAMGSLESAGSEMRNIFNTVNGMPDIQLPQLGGDYRSKAGSLNSNLQGLSENMGHLNDEMSSTNDVMLADLSDINDQFSKIMRLYTDAIDGVLDMDYSTVYEDNSQEDAETSTDATIAGCTNHGTVMGDLNVSGIAGTMAIEYDFDLEGDVTGIDNARLNSTFLTKCVLRQNINEGNITAQKSYVGGISGLQEMGTILHCENYGRISSSSGNYVGGIAGQSLSYITNGYSKCTVSGEEHVAGIAGSGSSMENCCAMVRVQDASAFYGAIAGDTDTSGTVVNNFFVSDDIAGIDRISYSGKAEPVSYENLLELEGLPNRFRMMSVTFYADDEEVKRVECPYGGNVLQEWYPDIPAKDGFYADWDIREIRNIMYDEDVTVEYVRYLTTLASAQTRSNGQSVLLADGMFKREEALEVTGGSLNGSDDADIPLEDVTEYWRIIVPEDDNEQHQLRYQAPEGQTDGVRVYVKQNGEWQQADTELMGIYHLFTVAGTEAEIAVCVQERSIADYLVYIIPAAAAALIVVAIVVRKRKHSKSRKAGGDAESSELTGSAEQAQV